MNNVAHIADIYQTSLNNPGMGLNYIIQKTKDETGVNADSWCDQYFGISCYNLFLTMASGTLPPFIDFTQRGYQWTYSDKKEEFLKFYNDHFDVMNKAGYTPLYCVFILDNTFIVPVRDSEGVLSVFTTDIRFPHPTTYANGWPIQTLGEGAQRLVKAHITSVLMEAVENAIRL